MKSSKGKKPPHMKRKLKPRVDRLVVRKWGNSAGIRIPTSMMQAAKLELNDEVDASIEEGKIIVQRAVKRKYMLKELLKGVTPESCTDPFESLPPAGHEVW